MHRLYKVTWRALLLSLVFAYATLVTAQTGYNASRIHTFGATGSDISLIQNTLMLYHRLSWATTGAPAACTVALDSSVDGTVWVAGGIIAGQNCTAAGPSAVTFASANYVRITVTALTAGTTVRVVYEGWASAPNGGVNPTSGVVPINNGGIFVDSVIQPGATAPNGDVLAGNGTKFVDTVPGIDVSRTDATNSPATLDCSSTTGDRNRQVVLTFNGAITLPGTNWVPGVACDPSANAFIDVTGASAVVTFTPGGGTCNTTATCTMTQGFWRVRSTGTNTIVTVEPRTIIPPYPAAGTSVTMSASGYYKCSGACNVTFVPIPGNQYCVRNGDNVAAAITLVNVAGVQFEATAKTSYYAANRKLVSGAAITDQICYVVDSAGTHFDVWSSTGTWTDTAP